MDLGCESCHLERDHHDLPSWYSWWLLLVPEFHANEISSFRVRHWNICLALRRTAPTNISDGCTQWSVNDIIRMVRYVGELLWSLPRAPAIAEVQGTRQDVNRWHWRLILKTAGPNCLTDGLKYMPFEPLTASQAIVSDLKTHVCLRYDNHLEQLRWESAVIDVTVSGS